MSKAVRNIVSLPGTGRPENVLGVSHRYRLEAEQTGGGLICLETTVPPGHGVPPHMHQLEDEFFYVLDGQVELTGDDFPEAMVIGQGAMFYGPRGRMHGFRNPGQTPSRVLVMVTPGGSLQKMFEGLAALTAASSGRPDVEAVKAHCAKFEIKFAG